MASISVLCIANFPVDYTISVYMMTTLHFCNLYTAQSIYIAALLFLRNWKQWSKPNMLTMDHDFVLETSSSAAVYTLLNTIYLKSHKVFEYQTDRDLLNLR